MPTNVGTPHDWLRRAKSNLIRARLPKHKEVFGRITALTHNTLSA